MKNYVLGGPSAPSQEYVRWNTHHCNYRLLGSNGFDSIRGFLRTKTSERRKGEEGREKRQGDFGGAPWPSMSSLLFSSTSFSSLHSTLFPPYCPSCHCQQDFNFSSSTFDGICASLMTTRCKFCCACSSSSSNGPPSSGTSLF